MRRWRTSSEEETRRLGEMLGGELAPDGILLLSGQLGAGKTVLAQGVARALGVPANQVQSPSFILVREHQGTVGRFIHIDLYRLEPGETESLGLDEVLAGEGVKVIEWAERLPHPPASALGLEMRVGGEGADREILEIGLDRQDNNVEGSARPGAKSQEEQR
jgi:tRNA threonylcarbamoyladenosine biosynthesis protein TsaE